jgi:hypothetical protein
MLPPRSHTPIEPRYKYIGNFSKQSLRNGQIYKDIAAKMYYFISTAKLSDPEQDGRTSFP